jgi:hypothetical protein
MTCVLVYECVCVYLRHRNAYISHTHAMCIHNKTLENTSKRCVYLRECRLTYMHTYRTHMPRAFTIRPRNLVQNDQDKRWGNMLVYIHTYIHACTNILKNDQEKRQANMHVYITYMHACMHVYIFLHTPHTQVMRLKTEAKEYSKKRQRDAEEECA